MPEPAANAPLLVTGVPRSGTTWVARLLATARRTALTGREPMNPREKQYALGGTLTGWVRLETATPTQRRALRSAYRGHNPRVFGRYGRRQLLAPLPGTRVVIKDPFAMLSVPLIARETGAVALQVYRHPGAVLASYRRMGWTPDLTEIAALIEAHRVGPDGVRELWDKRDSGLSDAEEMGIFWAVLNSLVLDDLAAAPATLLVAHHELAAAGEPGVRRLFSVLGLSSTAATSAEMTKEGAAPVGSPQPAPAGGGQVLHRFDRSPAEVAQSWRKHVSHEDIDRIEQLTADVQAGFERHKLALTP